jgi:hypothetical protein
LALRIKDSMARLIPVVRSFQGTYPA